MARKEIKVGGRIGRGGGREGLGGRWERRRGMTRGRWAAEEGHHQHRVRR